MLIQGNQATNKQEGERRLFAHNSCKMQEDNGLPPSCLNPSYLWGFMFMFDLFPFSSEKSAFIYICNQEVNTLNCSIKRGVEMLLIAKCN